ncbi:MAG: CTP synthase [Candidatus Micrarchaeia archaeon]
MPTKYIVVLGSLMSGLGKGVVTASILKVLDFYNYNALPIKFDGYLNYDCGTMNPYRHGEVFVLDDKGEVDMDFGIYERFINKSMTKDSSITGGKLFGSIINKERKGEFLGVDVQIIPHLTNEAIGFIKNVSENKKPDVVIIEVGGTVGDIENSYFIEAVRQLALEEKVVFINLTYAPKMEVVGEQKTKPAQLGFRMLLQSGIRPNYVICRSKDQLKEETIKKLALFSNINEKNVFDDSDLESMYMLPLHFMDQNLDTYLIKELELEERNIDTKKLNAWKEKIGIIKNAKNKVVIGVIGKYTGLKDAYASIREAFVHAGVYNNTNVEIKWIESTDIEKIGTSTLENLDGLLVPGGFGKRGIEGMITAIKYARENKIPYLGICLGMQLMVVEYARNVCKLEDANSLEFDEKTKNPVISLMESQKNIYNLGGTMRLGAWNCLIKDKNSVAYQAYKKEIVSERHRHRYEFNNEYKNKLEECGLKITGTTEDGVLVEFVEWDKQFGIATQAHPELKSRFEEPAPLFVALVKASLDFSTSNKNISV